MPSTDRTSSTSDRSSGQHMDEEATGPAQRPVRILFVCTANRIRSPFAAALTTKLAAEHGLTIDVSSAGLTGDDEPAAESMVRTAKAFDVDLSAHRSRSVTAAVLEWADLVVTMTGRHVLSIVTIDTAARSRTLTLGEWAAAVRVDGPAPEWAATTKSATSRTLVVPAWTPQAIGGWARRVTDRPVDALLSRSTDVADPVGRSQRQFRHTAQEIDRLLRDGLGIGGD